jgi:predicted Zn-dependent protease with MMP-like domain
MNKKEFDKIITELINDLPQELADKLKAIPVISMDEMPDYLIETESERDDEINYDTCGLTKSEFGLQQIFIFRKPILRQSGPDKKKIKKEIEITLYHEIGHIFGLEEKDLIKLGL